MVPHSVSLISSSDLVSAGFGARQLTRLLCFVHFLSKHIRDSHLFASSLRNPVKPSPVFLLSAQSNLYFSHGWLAPHRTSGNIYLSKLQQVRLRLFMLCCVHLQTQGFVSPTGSRRLIDLRSVFVRFLRALPCHFSVCCRRAGQP